MIAQACPLKCCQWDDTVEEESEEVCRCQFCGARFEIDPDADFDGDHWSDCSTVGERIPDDPCGADGCDCKEAARLTWCRVSQALENWPGQAWEHIKAMEEAAHKSFLSGVNHSLGNVSAGVKLLQARLSKDPEGDPRTVGQACLDAATAPAKVVSCRCGSAACYQLDDELRCWGCVDHETSGRWHSQHVLGERFPRAIRDFNPERLK